MTEIALLNPASLVQTETRFVIHHGIAPIGMAYIAGALKREGLEFTLVDALGEGLRQYRTFHKKQKIYLRGIDVEEVIERLPSTTKYICISSMYACDWVYQIEFIKKLKLAFPESYIIVGGENPTSFWHRILMYESDVDFCVLGEADDILPKLIKTLKDGQSYKELHGIAFRDSNGQPVMTERAERLQDLTSYKPDWDQFPLDNYFAMKTTVRAYGKRTMPIVASRGCAYRCHFCTSLNKWGTTYITRPVEDVVAEFREYKEKYNIDHICMVDLASSINQDWFLSLCRALAQAKIGVTWEMSSGTRSEFLDRDNIQLLIDSGCYHLILSPDSGSMETLEKIEKRLDYKQFNEVVKDVVDMKLRLKLNFIVGMRKQSLNDVLATYKEALRFGWMGVDDVSIYTFIPFPGTKMHDDMVKAGEISINNREEYDTYIWRMAMYSIVAVNNPGVDYKYNVEKYSLVIMTMAFILSLIRRPRSIFTLINRLWHHRPVGIFEVAIYMYFYEWPLLVAQIKWKEYKQKKRRS